MKHRSILLALAVLSAGVGFTLWADSPAEEGPSKGAGANAERGVLIAKLAEMKGSDRRAYLKKLAPEERRGLWMEARRLRAEDRATKAPAKGSGYATPTPVDVEPGEEWTTGGPTVGTISYDSGFPSVGFGGGQLVGNRFSTHTAAPVLASGTVSTVQAVVVPGAGLTTSSAGFVMYGPQTGGGGAMAVASTFTTASGVIDTVNFTGLGINYTGSSFFVLFGDFSSSYIPVLGTGTVNAQGHHGRVGYTGGMGPNITATGDLGGTLNAFVRATGNILPVELMSFRID